MPDEKKIIIDEDWKSQVQAEKEQAAKAQQAASSEATTAKTRPKDMRMPPASLEMLLTTLATEALVALGQLPHPMTGDLHVDRDQAKYLIDTIEVLHEKTKGNLTPAEQQLIDGLLHQMRLVFVETAAQSAETPSGAK